MTMMTVIYGCFLEGGHTLAVETGGRNEVSKDNHVLGGHTLKIPQVTEEEAIGKSGCFRLNTPHLEMDLAARPARRMGSGGWSGSVVAGYNLVLSAEKAVCVYKVAARDGPAVFLCWRTVRG